MNDQQVSAIIEAVEQHVGMGHGAWDMVSARELVEGFAVALQAGADEPSFTCGRCGCMGEFSEPWHLCEDCANEVYGKRSGGAR